MTNGGWPAIRHHAVSHVGTMVPALKGTTHNKTSLEGSGLSVSLHPHVWRSIARLGDAPVWRLSREDQGLFVDARQVTSDQHAVIAHWGHQSGLVSPATLFKATWTDEGDQFTATYLSKEAAEGETAELECNALSIEPLDGWLATPDMARRIGMKIDPGLVQDLLLTLYAEDVLYRQYGFHGVWWNDRLDEFALSAPRGVIHKRAVSYWDAVNQTDSAAPAAQAPRYGKGQLLCSYTDGTGTVLHTVFVKARLDHQTQIIHPCGDFLHVVPPVGNDCPEFPVGWDPFLQADPVSGLLLDDVIYHDDEGFGVRVTRSADGLWLAAQPAEGESTQPGLVSQPG